MPITYKNLYPQIYAFENLHRAFRAARKHGKRSRAGVAGFEHNLEFALTRLQSELETETYAPGAYRHFYVQERKRRKISAAPFRDRVVHHALCRIVQPIFDTRFIYDSYACRVGKGTHRAIERAQEFMRHNQYALQCDVMEFFPSIDHAILRAQLAHPLADPAVMGLIDKILASGQGVLASEYTMHYFPNDELFAANRPRGLPIGNLTSQLWANVYLNALDTFVKHTLRGASYVRYADDFLLFANDKEILQRWRAQIIEFLQTLRLRLHETRAVVFPTRDGLNFLGFRLFHDHRRLRPDNPRRFARRLRGMAEKYNAGEITFEKIDQRITSWIAHAKFGDTYRLRQKIFQGALFERAQP